MVQRSVAARGRLTVEDCWQRYADLDQWQTWSPQIREVRASSRRLVEGLRGTVVGPVGIQVAFEVLAVDTAARQWKWRVNMGGAKVTMTHLLGTDGDRSVATLIADGPAIVVLPYLPVAALALSRLTRG
ncbi:polyketide cyclase/dehydrase/lipid transport protein [Branchiibius hedensis]|uniref:Polyketide cyclase / dehydrase and lipid transport n=1 Tax=Branchiibius hedensis TaxID=672460 RepID=A0A2Y8ZXK0_9MICO|nr:SRPBCC family protein [Branchiibius hedensis]PWJ27446.1 polyketide cyclase/dehydrase/lipid transport protein [Branchiibius hedensis]SSA36256.1 Polyketide cyclase / dehydrase and lipid transport [Branchiibius hedensis]